MNNSIVSNRMKDKVCVITGGASGIGLASAKRLAAEGGVVVIADLDETKGSEVANELGGMFVKTNVADEDSVRNLFSQVIEHYERVDVAFNNAGINPNEDNSVLTTDLSVWAKVQTVNLTSVYLCCKYALEQMVKQKSGSIINTASFVALMGAATSQISYSASKGGVLSMSRELGVQFAKKGIRVNALCPGPVNTPLLRELFAKDPVQAQRRLVHVPRGRFGEPEEIAAAVAFLASDDASFVNAATFTVDGGISAAYVTAE